MKKKKILLIIPILAIFISGGSIITMNPAANPLVEYDKPVNLSKEMLKDKIKGGWAGQVIGCTYGGPTEFKYNGMIIGDDINIPWDEGRMQWYYDNAPGLYDDVYMDLTFVDVFEKEGLDAPASSHARAFANAEYMLWHANQAARYNILNGIAPPASGHWENNPHSDDIDFQIEADFAGLMAPGMPNTASEICDKVGHIMNYGDGWYGGVYVAAMYSLAFVSDDVDFIVHEGLKAVPAKSTFYQCIADVIKWHSQYPNNWKKTWQEVENKWSSDLGCPDGVHRPFNIDAKINAAYIVIGMLYGQGDYGKSIDISTRCGQDSDCNPASVGGILGTMMGYSNIPAHWKQGIDKVVDRDFKYTTISLNDVYELGYKHALEVLGRNGGSTEGDQVSIKIQKPKAVKFEQGFAGLIAKDKLSIAAEDNKLNELDADYSFAFDGVGFVLRGKSTAEEGVDSDYIHQLEVIIDGMPGDTVDLPESFTTRRHELYWKYNLREGKHEVEVKLINPKKGHFVQLQDVVVYAAEK